MAKVIFRIQEKFKHTMIAFCEENQLKVEFSDTVDENGNVAVSIYSKKAEQLFLERYKKIMMKYGLNK